MNRPPKPPTLASLDVQRITIDAQGCDHTGAYWGAGHPVHIGTTQDAAHELTLRAPNARAARRHVQR